MKHYFLYLVLITTVVYGQDDYWTVKSDGGIHWDLTPEKRLPHKENIEMSGQQVSAIVYYEVDKDRNLTVNRDVIFPQLRTYSKSGEPDWKKYRAYFRRTAGEGTEPTFKVGDKVIMPKVLDSVTVTPYLTFHHAPYEGVQITRKLYPSMTARYLVEEWQVTNTTSEKMEVQVGHATSTQVEYGYKGKYTFTTTSDAPSSFDLLSGGQQVFSVYYGALLNDESAGYFEGAFAKAQREKFLAVTQENLIVNTPDPALNQLFAFSKVRASESIFKSSTMGLVHSPGGGNYYLGIWANDQVEYSGPFFPYLGYDVGNEAAYNTYAHFKKYIPKDDGFIPYAFEVDGNFVMDFSERGDAAMIAYGTSKYVLARGDIQEAQELWPLIEWSINYCHNHRNEKGAVISQTDEMEGRIETGDANLSTSSLYYGGLKFAAKLAKTLDKKKLAKTYEKRALVMKDVINTYFGTTLEGEETYRYFDGNEYLRHWICLPLSMGITERKEGTLNALFDQLWTENGILVEKNPTKEQKVFWDRGTLYALRGAFKVGASDRALDKLTAYSRKRLLGDHVPYVVEAYPENNMKHLSAESALYCRIYTEGILGIEPSSFNSFTIRPSLPSSWDFMQLKKMKLFGKSIDINLRREGTKIEITITTTDGYTMTKIINNYEQVTVTF